jgi:hypothetical protein
VRLLDRLLEKLGVDRKGQPEREQRDQEIHEATKRALDRIARLARETDAYYDSLRRNT